MERFRQCSLEELEELLTEFDGPEFEKHLHLVARVEALAKAMRAELESRRYNASMAAQQKALEERVMHTPQNTTQIKLAWLGIAVAIALGLAGFLISIFRK